MGGVHPRGLGGYVVDLGVRSCVGVSGLVDVEAIQRDVFFLANELLVFTLIEGNKRVILLMMAVGCYGRELVNGSLLGLRIVREWWIKTVAWRREVAATLRVSINYFTLPLCGPLLWLVHEQNARGGSRMNTLWNCCVHPDRLGKSSSSSVVFISWLVTLCLLEIISLIKQGEFYFFLTFLRFSWAKPLRVLY